MEKICDTPLVEFDIYNVFDIKDLRHNIRAMEADAAAKILDMYKEIITYIIIVYEGFEPYITQVTHNILEIDKILQYATDKNSFNIAVDKNDTKQKFNSLNIILFIEIFNYNAKFLAI